ncbi:MAG: hypothetical protein JW902_06030 [Syntrophaceae bacterium]|nr:hypothetical protein [Syntrophaceae bacterium]
MGTAIASMPLFTKGWFIAHDCPAHIYRIIATCYELQQGNYYPRWLSLALYGKGLPDLNFYSPGFYLVISWLHVFGIPLALTLKAFSVALSVLGAFGIYLWVRKYTDTPGALISSTIFLFIPYRFLDIYVRGALPEFAALSFLPWLFYSIDLSFSQAKSHRGIVFTALTAAVIVLTHHLSAILIAPFALIYFSWHCVAARKEPRKILFAATGLIVGAGISAFYWLPVLIEMKHVSFNNPYRIWDHFVYPAQWFNSKWDFGYSVVGPNDGMSFQIGPVLIGATVLAVLLIRWVPLRTREFGLLLLFFGLFGLFMTTKYSSPIYESASFLQVIQFPWRFLGPATLFFAALSGLSTSLPIREIFSWSRWILFYIILVFSIYISSNQRVVQHQKNPIDLDLFEKKIVASGQVGGHGMAREFLPKWATFDPDKKLDEILLIEPRQNFNAVSSIHIKGPSITFSITSDRSSSVTIPWYYFPGWQVTINGKQKPITIDQNGFISFIVLPGSQNIKVWFGSTWPRITGWLLTTTFGLLLFAGMLAPSNSLRKKTSFSLLKL